MNWAWLMPITILVPLAGAMILRFGPFRADRKKVRLLTGAFVLATAILAIVCSALKSPELCLFEILPDAPIYFRADGISRLFAILTTAMWLCSTVFSFEYMKHEEREDRYCMFSMLALGAIMGVCFSGNLVTTYIFYELMTLASFPLVMHEQTKTAVSAGLAYLYYSLAGAFLGLVGVFFFYHYAEVGAVTGGRLAYIEGGFLRLDLTGNQVSGLLVVLFLMLLGLGSKVGMYPLHGWLPKAHPEAPAPASALLSGNITKMGILFIIRVVYYAAGPDFLRDTWVQYALLVLTLFTIFLGSMMAFREKVFKKRLAYSTVSQTSYCLVGLYLLTPVGMVGALLHVIFHSTAKNLLFLCAGAVIYKTGKRKVAQLKGIGRRMPVTMWCFTIGGLALVGIPPLSGFVSKWYLAGGALDSQIAGFKYAVPVVLIISALLTAGYLLGVTADAFFDARSGEEKPENEPAAEEAGAETAEKAETKRDDVGPLMWVPMLLLAASAVILGLFPGGLINWLARIATTVLL